MLGEAFRKREQALEDAFFYQVDQQLLADLRERLELQAAKQRLATVTGWSDTALLEQLAAIHVSPEALAALAVLPAIFVAWADGKVDEQERTLILSEGRHEGVKPGSDAEKLLEKWLSEPPTQKLRDAWRAYLQAVAQNLSAKGRQAMRDAMMWKAEVVARASGGSFGVMRISPSEKKELDAIEGILD